MLKKKVSIQKMDKKGAVDGFVYIICAANNHRIATVSTYGRGGKPMAEQIRDAINESISKA